MLEDDFTYVIRKALKGHGLAPSEAAARARLPEQEVLAFSKGQFSADIARRLAPALALNPHALANHDRYSPKPLVMPEIHRLDLPFGNERVNAWFIWTHDGAILFDTGCESRSCADLLEKMCAPDLDEIFITHAHHDHIGGLPPLIARGKKPRGCGIKGTEPMNPGDEVDCGMLKIRACDLSGHADPSLGFHVEGLDCPVLVTGDALFAGSMGGTDTPELYHHALERLREVLGPLPDRTILLPGHGPGTTLGEERESNPFL